MSKYHEVWSEFLKGEVEWCVSNEILSEYMEIMERKTSPWLAEAVVNVILNNERTVRVTPSMWMKTVIRSTSIRRGIRTIWIPQEGHTIMIRTDI